ncbi:MBL fold metallo-hydrolase [Alicyclobacillus tolerans]|uniref:MBL fold metallo-hydrolase n=1 Tax=Alicyclobacillus tolerans TaxID=90970 RepID=UPI001F376013|nr:MBL fold metallo-hydrolase [Alicyclobacillus tolerans]MCF8563649.1 MBL fold metallo-hydrolase [Alicyclobacillus tolerans]
MVEEVLSQDQKQTLTIHRIELPTPFPVGPVNAYLLISNQQVVLVDCGPKTDEARQALLQGLSDVGFQPKDITALVLTHGHIDHVGLTAMLREQGVPVYAHPEVATWLDAEGRWSTYRGEFFERLYNEMGMPAEVRERALKELSLHRDWTDQSVVDVPLEDGGVFPPLPDFRVLYVPGHAQAAIALYREDTGEFVVGDQLLQNVSSNALIEPKLNAPRGSAAKRTMSLIQYRQNLKFLATLKTNQVFPGHGDIFTDAAGLIAKRLREQTRRRDQFYEMLKTSGPCSAYGLATRYFTRHRNQASLILSETLGYLDWMKEMGWIQEQTGDDGIAYWSVVKD